jgi:hypothetical protein
LTDTDNPRFILELNLTNTGHRVKVQDPTILTDKIMDQAWGMVSDFVIDMLDDLKLEVTDEQFREIFIETCYHLVYREMRTLQHLPIWEQGWKERLGTRKRGARVSSRKDPYGLKEDS